MLKIDPIIAVKDVHASAEWYQAVFGCKRTHGGNEFAVLEDQNGVVLICLHKWGEHEHPTMLNPEMSIGNGVILYLKTDQLEVVRTAIEKIAHPVEEEIHMNPNSLKKEFSLRDPDGYWLIVTEYHNYEG